MMRDVRQQIIDLEAEIEVLTETAQRCERVHIGAKVFTAAGAFLIVAASTGVFGFGMGAFLCGITGALGGIALFGSNRQTHQEVLGAIEVKAMRRAELIDALEWGAKSTMEGTLVVNSPSISPP